MSHEVLHKVTLISRLTALSKIIRETLPKPWQSSGSNIYREENPRITLNVSLGGRHKFLITIQEDKS